MFLAFFTDCTGRFFVGSGRKTQRPVYAHRGSDLIQLSQLQGWRKRKPMQI